MINLKENLILFVKLFGINYFFTESNELMAKCQGEKSLEEIKELKIDEIIQLISNMPNNIRVTITNKDDDDEKIELFKSISDEIKTTFQ